MKVPPLAGNALCPERPPPLFPFVSTQAAPLGRRIAPSGEWHSLALSLAQGFISFEGAALTFPLPIFLPLTPLSLPPLLQMIIRRAPLNQGTRSQIVTLAL